jgi:hypothetical protein
VEKESYGKNARRMIRKRGWIVIVGTKDREIAR